MAHRLTRIGAWMAAVTAVVLSLLLFAPAALAYEVDDDEGDVDNSEVDNDQHGQHGHVDFDAHFKDREGHPATDRKVTFTIVKPSGASTSCVATLSPGRSTTDRNGQARATASFSPGCGEGIYTLVARTDNGAQVARGVLVHSSPPSETKNRHDRSEPR